MKKSSLIKGGFWVTAGTFARRIFALLSNLVLARLLSPEDFGVISVAWIFWSFFALFMQSSGGLFILYKGTEDRRYLDTVHTISCIIGLFLASVLALGSPWIAQFFNESQLTGILYLYAVNLLISSVFYVYEGILMRLGKYKSVAIILFASSLVRLLFTVLCAVLGFRYWSFAIGDTAFWLVSLIAIVWQTGYILHLKISRSIFSEVVSYCLGTVGTSFGFYANLNLDNFVVSKLLGNSSLGYYNLAYQLTTSVTKILNPVIDRVGTPVFAKLSGDKVQKEALLMVMRQVAFLVTPIYALLYLSLDARTIVFLFGENWRPIVELMPWLIITSYCRTVNIPLKSMVAAKGLPNINAKVNLYIIPLALGSFVVGAQQGGILGVSIAVAISLGFCLTIYWWMSASRMLGWPISEFSTPFIKPLMLSLAALAIASPFVSGIKQIVFIAIFTVGFKLLNPSQFDNYVALAKEGIKKLPRKLTTKL